jgi:hypothetical protein|nr:MAG TPA: Dephospho-CoA kinase [Caudoviricetes sp.]
MILVGRAGVGKDTVAEMFGDIPRYAYADAIKEMVAIIQSDGVNAGMNYISDLSGHSVEELQGILPVVQTIEKTVLDGKQRKHLQALGNGIRALFADFWLVVLKNKLIRDNPNKYIVTDCRYQNELDMLRELQVGDPSFNVSIFISANKKERIKRMKQRDGSCDETRLNDVSETSVDELKSQCDFVINNSKDFNHLKVQVDKIKDTIGE